MWTYNQTADSDELFHHGVLGQRWGIRRYQRKDGTLTKAGIKQYLKKNEKQLNIANKALSRANEALDLKTFKVMDNRDEVENIAFNLSGTNPTKKQKRNLETASKNYEDSYKEYTNALDKVNGIEAYIKALSYQPIDYASAERVSKGREFVLEFYPDNLSE